MAYSYMNIIRKGCSISSTVLLQNKENTDRYFEGQGLPRECGKNKVDKNYVIHKLLQNSIKFLFCCINGNFLGGNYQSKNYVFVIYFDYIDIHSIFFKKAVI